MHDPIFAKSFTPYERKRIGFCALILCWIVALSFSAIFKPSLHPLPKIDDVINSQLMIRAIENMFVRDGISNNFKPTETNTCKTTEANANYCEIEGDIRIETNTSTIFVLTRNEIVSISNPITIQPYSKKDTPGVKNWTIYLVKDNVQISNIPKCTQTHTLPSILFSVGGYSGNFFHDFSDIIIPLYSKSFHFQKQVHFLVTDYIPRWKWIPKYRQILNELTKYEILDIDSQKSRVHCFSKLIIGLEFHKELIPSQSYKSSMQNFRQLLKQAYSLEKKTTTKIRKGQQKTKPRLMILSRRKTRVLTNEHEISQLARKLGYEVDLAESENPKNLSKFAQRVNSCDVLMGMHGAGLTNMFFLPDNGILIQVIPFGDIDKIARNDFGNPTTGMNIRYLEYKVTVNESSLSRQYPVDDPVLKDPKSFTAKGWDVFGSIYLNNQNVTIDLGRFEGVLAKTLKLLRR